MLHQDYCKVTTSNVTYSFMQPNKDLWRKFGDFLKAERKKRKLSQEGAAHTVGLTRQQWNRLENAESGTTRKTANQIAEGFQIDPEKVLQLAGFTNNSISLDEIIEDEELKFMFHDSANWSKESREDAVEMAKDIFRRFQERERRKNEGN